MQAFRLKAATTEVAKLHNVHNNINLHPKIPHLRSQTRANSDGIPVICRRILRRAAALCGKMVKIGASTSPHAAPRLPTIVIVENIHHASTSYWCCSLIEFTADIAPPQQLSTRIIRKERRMCKKQELRNDPFYFVNPHFWVRSMVHNMECCYAANVDQLGPE